MADLVPRIVEQAAHGTDLPDASPNELRHLVAAGIAALLRAQHVMPEHRRWTGSAPEDDPREGRPFGTITFEITFGMRSASAEPVASFVVTGTNRTWSARDDATCTTEHGLALPLAAAKRLAAGLQALAEPMRAGRYARHRQRLFEFSYRSSRTDLRCRYGPNTGADGYGCIALTRTRYRDKPGIWETYVADSDHRRCLMVPVPCALVPQLVQAGVGLAAAIERYAAAAKQVARQATSLRRALVLGGAL